MVCVGVWCQQVVICSEHSRNCGCVSRNASTVCVRVCYGESLLVPGGCHWLVAGAWWVGRVWCYVGWYLVGSTVCVRVCYCESAWWLVGLVVGWGEGAGGHASLPSDRPDTCTASSSSLCTSSSSLQSYIGYICVTFLHCMVSRHCVYYTALDSVCQVSNGHLADTSSRHVLESYHAVVCGFHTQYTFQDTGRNRWSLADTVGVLSCSLVGFIYIPRHW